MDENASNSVSLGINYAFCRVLVVSLMTSRRFLSIFSFEMSKISFSNFLFCSDFFH